MADQSVVRADLRRAWQALLPDQPRLGEELLTAWSNPVRRYHDLTHLSECLSALTDLGSDRDTEYFALWFHDAVHTNSPGLDERRSAELAEDRLSAVLPAAEVAEVSRLVRLTIDHDPQPDDLSGIRVCDADLAILGATPTRYRASVAALREEEAILTAAQWRQVRLRRLEQLLGADPLFHSPIAVQRWGEQALANLSEEFRQLQSSRHIN